MRKKRLICVLILLIMCMTTTVTYAVDISPIINGKWNSSIDSDVNNIRGSVIAIVEVIGVSIAVIMLVVLAIKYMTSSPNDRAEVKKHMIPYFIGAILIFGAVGVVQIIRQFTEGTINK